MKKSQQKIVKQRLCMAARTIACASFLILTIIGVSSLVRAMSLETIANENGVPASWQAASLGAPETITIPATFWDQRQDDCDDINRQFEWVICGYWTKGAIQGLVKNNLGSDGLPVPAFTNATDSWNVNRDVFTANVTGNDPVQPGDNFYRWFHEVSGLSQRIDGRTAIFTRVGNSNTYSYGRDGIFPLDDVSFSDADEATTKEGHNFHFTSHLRIPVKIAANGTEEFYFSGDDDVWVFLNNQLVLDIGGLHEKLEGRFKINADGTVTTYVQHVNNTSGRAVLGEPNNDFNGYVNPLNEYNERTFKDITKTIDIGLHEGDVVNLDFFYAERSTTESNTNITITNMNWPISADSDITAEVVGKVANSENKLVEFNTSVKNRDPEHPLYLERLAAYIQEATSQGTNEGYLPLDETTLYYTTTPEDESSWQPVNISAPGKTTNGFNLTTPIHMAPAGQPGDTLYFRYYGETSEYSGTMTSTISYYTTLNGNAGVTYDYDKVSYTGVPDETPVVPVPKTPTVTIKYLYEDDSEAAPEYHETHEPGDEFKVTSPEIENYTPDYPEITGTVENEDLVYIVRYKKPAPDPRKVTIKYLYEDDSVAAPEYNGTYKTDDTFDIPSPEISNYTVDFKKITGTVEGEDLVYIVRYKAIPVIPTFPSTNLIDGSLLYLAPLGEVAFVPNTGIVSDVVANLFSEDFAEVILSQALVMVMLLIFAGSFATYFSLRKFLVVAPATRSASTKKMPKMPTKNTKTAKNAKKITAKSAKNAKRTTMNAKSAAKKSKK